MPRYAPTMSQTDLRQILIDLAVANDFIEEYGDLDPDAPQMWRIVDMLISVELVPQVE